jgi:parvulin-like peptidyl-prolyl isomerase
MQETSKDTATAEPRTHANRRSLLLFTCGALLGLAFAGYSLFTAKGTRTNTVPPEAMVLINGRPILRSDFTTQVQTLFSLPFDQSTPAQRREVLDNMIAEELSVQRGVEIDLASFDPDVRAAMVAGVELTVTASVLARQPAPEQMRQWYEKRKEKYASDASYRLRDFVARTGPTRDAAKAAIDAAQAAAALRSGQSPEQVAKHFGLEDSGRVDAGVVFDFAAKAKLAATVYAAASRLASGTVSDPVAAPDGVHLVVMIEHQASKPQAYETVADRVWADYKREANEQVLRSSLDYLRSRADVQLSEEAKALQGKGA